MADLFNSGNDPLAALNQDTSAQRTQVAQYSILRAATFLQNNDNAAALKEFKKALAFDSQNQTAQTYIGKINLSMGNTYEAIKAFKTLVQSQPNSVEAHMNLANAYIQDKQYAASESELKAAARLDPANPLPDYTLGLQYSNTDRLQEAESQFLKVQKISPKDGNVYYALGRVYNQQGRYEEAAANLEKALAFKKSFPDANYELGFAYNALGRTEDSQKQLDILKEAGSALVSDLSFVIEKPGIISMDTKNSGGFIEGLGPGTPLWMLDPTLLTAPNSSKTFTVNIQFSNQMDAGSVTNPLNWSISRSYSEEGGYYNSYMPLSPNEIKLPANPEAVRYNSLTQEASITFRLPQNAAGDAVVDPSHLSFKFSGKDAFGREMDPNANEITGYSVVPF